jgi:seryl-tRNA(Sec) selenium transferase
MAVSSSTSNSVRIPETPQESLRLVTEAAQLLETQPFIRNSGRMTASGQSPWSQQAVQQTVDAIQNLALGFSTLAAYAIQASYQQGQAINQQQWGSTSER